MLYQYLRKIMPAIGETERIALEAGDTWWEKEMFSGQPNWSKLNNHIKLSRLNKREEAFLNYEVDKLCDLLLREGGMSDEIMEYIKDKGFLGLGIPQKYGGHEFSAQAQSDIISKVSTANISAAVTIMVPNSIGPAELILEYGTQEQKDKYLQRLATGKEIPCFGLTTPDAGSDATAMQDTGTVLAAGNGKLYIELNFNKRYITLAPISTLIGLAFKLYDPDHLLGDQEDLGITVALIKSDHDGVDISKRHQPLHQSFPNGPIRGDKVLIRADDIIGGPRMAGQGWKMLMEALSVGRGISLPALASASAQVAYQTTGAYTELRKQFRTSLNRFEGVQEPMARIAGYSYIIEATRRFTLAAIDSNEKPSLATAITKYHLTEMSRKIINDAMDIHGGRAIQSGPSNYLGEAYDAIPISITVEGANILTRNLMIFGQGVVRCHEHLLPEMQLLQSGHKKEFYKVLRSHVKATLKNTGRALLHSLTGGRFIKEHRHLTRMSTILAVLSDAALLSLGGDLKRRERLSARLGDILSNLYMASAVIKYKQKGDDVYSDWAMKHLLHEAQVAVEGVLDNLPSKVTAWLLRKVIFNLKHKKPSDKEDKALARAMSTDSHLRNRLKGNVHMGGPVDDLERAFIFRNEELIKRVMQVDEFDK